MENKLTTAGYQALAAGLTELGQAFQVP